METLNDKEKNKEFNAVENSKDINLNNLVILKLDTSKIVETDSVHNTLCELIWQKVQGMFGNDEAKYYHFKDMKFDNGWCYVILENKGEHY